MVITKNKNQGFHSTVRFAQQLHGELVALESRSLPRQRARWPWITKFLKEKVVVAEARVELVLVKKIGQEHRLIRNVPDQISGPLQKLQLGPEVGLYAV